MTRHFDTYREEIISRGMESKASDNTVMGIDTSSTLSGRQVPESDLKLYTITEGI